MTPNNTFSAKVYQKKRKEDDQRLALYCKDYVFSKYMAHDSILSVKYGYLRPRRIHIYDNIEGGTLADMMRRSIEMPNEHRISYQSAWTIMKQLMEAIEYIHKRKIIHRNITPKNIVFMESDDLRTLKLINFESALFCGDPDEIEDHCNALLK